MRRSRIALMLLAIGFGAGGLVGLSGTAAVAVPPASPLNFQLPFDCGQKWQLTTYPTHDPVDKKIDFFRMDGTTNGSSVVASADGTVYDTGFDTGGGNFVEINHGNRWFSLYLHMQNNSIVVSEGQTVRAGQKLGLVGATGANTSPNPHLHYELRYDFNNNGDSTNAEQIRPIFNGEEFNIPANGPYPQRYSHNCGEGPAATSTSSRMDVFVRGTNREIYQNTSTNGSTWSGWRSTGVGLLTSSPTAVAWTDRNGSPRIDLFANGAEDGGGISQVFQKTSYDGGNTWGSWVAIGGNLTTQPAAAAKEGTLYLFGRGTNGTLYSRTLVPRYIQQLDYYEYNWNNWVQRTSDRLNSAPTAANYRNDQVQVWYTRTDLHPYQVFWSDTTQTWEGPMQPGGGIGNITAAMGLMQWSDRFEVYGRGTDRRVYYKWYSSSWTGWSQLSNLSATSGGLASTLFNGHSQLFSRGQSGNVLWSPPIYAPWVSLGGVAI
ncbi:MAG: M23 family metallopeptidase [Sporichthyaceae bacterium]|nr:M23 family metallopeptidase [Sporichthyaceae bacterium]